MGGMRWMGHKCVYVTVTQAFQGVQTIQHLVFSWQGTVGRLTGHHAGHPAHCPYPMQVVWKRLLAPWDLPLPQHCSGRCWALHKTIYRVNKCSLDGWLLGKETHPIYICSPGLNTFAVSFGSLAKPQPTVTGPGDTVNCVTLAWF